MPRTRRSFTPEGLSIIQEAEREGYMETCRKYNLSPTLLSRWKQKYQAKGVEGLKPAYRRVDPEVRALEEEKRAIKAHHRPASTRTRGKDRDAKKNSYPTQEKIAMVKRYSDRVPVRLVSHWLSLPSSTFYYKRHPGPRGKTPSTHTTCNGEVVPMKN